VREKGGYLSHFSLSGWDFWLKDRVDLGILKKRLDYQGVNDDQKVYAFVFTFRVNSHLFPDG